MAKSIIEMALAKVDKVKNDSGEAGQNATLAIAAVNGGIRSAAWRSYMMQFIEQNPPGQPVDPAQLERLLGTDGTLGLPDIDRSRAYLVSNAICASGTEFTTGNGVFGIDATLPNPGPSAVTVRRLGGKTYKKPASKASKKSAKKAKKSAKKAAGKAKVAKKAAKKAAKKVAKTSAKAPATTPVKKAATKKRAVRKPTGPSEPAMPMAEQEPAHTAPAPSWATPSPAASSPAPSWSHNAASPSSDEDDHED